MIELEESGIYEFEEFRLDAKRRRLFRSGSGELVPLTPKAAEVLIYLVVNAGRVLSKDELLEKVWENSFVEESNLSQTIFVLRKTLGEDTRNPRFILTVPNRGYQFIAPVREPGSGDEILEEAIIAEETPPPAAPAAVRKSPLRRPAGLLAVPLAALVVFAVYWFYPRSKPAGIGGIRTIAILPFEDLSAEQNDKYLGISLADALAEKFGVMKELTVRPTRSVLKYAESRDDPAAIGRALEADAVIDGRIQRAGERIRVNVQLIRTADNATLWTGSFDDRFTNFFDVQDAISQKVVQTLALRMNDRERERFNRRGTENAEAYQDYLRGRFHWNKRTLDGLQKAIASFEDAVRKDPNFAAAHAGLADCYVLLPEYSGATTHEAFPKARAAIGKALELDDQQGGFYATLGYAQAFYDWDFAGAERSFKRAVELGPHDATARQWYAEFLGSTGRFDESYAQFALAVESDPVSPIILTDLATNYYLQERYDETIDRTRKIIELNPNFGYAYYWLALSYERQGRDAEAVETFCKTSLLFGEPPAMVEQTREAFRKNGLRGWWQKRIEQIEGLAPYPAYLKALAHARVGDREKALVYLAQSVEQRERFVVALRLVKDFDLLKNDPRYQELVRRIGA
ncbi:MAG: winged helix-turn-helix domain-containing protein [Acidobacteria bacterium]|nr:winged helix-turn-helix domain-containing protein [Acidobacteriota bacterium]